MQIPVWPPPFPMISFAKPLPIPGLQKAVARSRPRRAEAPESGGQGPPLSGVRRTARRSTWPAASAARKRRVRIRGTQSGIQKTTTNGSNGKTLSEEHAGQDKRSASQEFASLGKRNSFSPIALIEHVLWLANQRQVSVGLGVLRYPVAHRG